MADFFYSIDLYIFYFFNHSLSCKPFDKFFSLITDVQHWIIAYIILWGILISKEGRKSKIAAILVLVLITVSDQLGYRVLKEIFGRIRPCYALTDVLTPLGPQGTFSFPSNHALNNFAAATYFYFLYPKLKWILFSSAALIAISRVYLGLHYPSDIIGGAAIGVGIGFLFYKLHLIIERKLNKIKG